MARSRVKLNSAGVQEYLDGKHGVEEMLRSKARPVLAAAIADPHDDTGAYEDGLEIQVAHTDRMVVRVVSTDFKGHILESEYGILSGALDAAGGT